MREHAMIFLKGLLMGAADVIPGVSGGTIAFITQIYERLINALSNLSVAGKLFLQRKHKLAWKKVDVNLFVPLGIGIGGAFLIGSAVIPGLIERHPGKIFSFFTGLIIASSWIIYRRIKKHTGRALLLGFFGLLLAVAIARSPTLATAPSTPFLFFLGMIAICAMLLPGVSGSYILLMFGQYEYILEAVHARDIVVIGTFIVGAIIGLLAFSKLLRYLLQQYHDETFHALLGIMIGALYRPGSIVIGSSASPGSLVLLLLIGMVAVLGIEKLAHRKP